MPDSDDEYTIPLQDQRIFGAGLKRKRVHFVPSSTPRASISTPPIPTTSTSPKSIGDLYLSLVLPKSSEAEPKANTVESESPQSAVAEICEICNLPLPSRSDDDDNEDDAIKRRKKRKPHEASLAHQVCLTHSHPPSHIDRTRKGLAYLSSYGWDPDSRLGLGATGQGIQFPIKPKSKQDANDKMGVGLVVPKEVMRDAKTRAEWRKKDQKLDAKKVREMEERGRRERVGMQEMFYRSEDVERYLGKG